MRVQNSADRKSNGVALGHVSCSLERHRLMIEPGNLKVAVAITTFLEVSLVGGDTGVVDAFGSGEARIGVRKGGWVMGKWR